MRKTIRCNDCNRRVRIDFIDKFNHVIKHHPERLIANLPILSGAAFRFGEMLGDRLKGKLAK